MAVTSLVVSIILTVIVLIMSLVTISKGYGFKHTIDPIPEEKDSEKYTNSPS